MGKHSVLWPENDYLIIEGAKNKMSPRDIGKEIGCTKNAVSGRAFRLGINFSKPKTYRLRKAKAPLKRVAKAPPLPTPEPMEKTSESDNILYDSGSFHKTLLDRGTDECAWPVNDRDIDGEHFYCAHETEPGQSYCAHHRARGTQPYRPRQRNLR